MHFIKQCISVGADSLVYMVYKTIWTLDQILLKTGVTTCPYHKASLQSS